MTLTDKYKAEAIDFDKDLQDLGPEYYEEVLHLYKTVKDDVVELKRDLERAAARRRSTGESVDPEWFQEKKSRRRELGNRCINIQMLLGKLKKENEDPKHSLALALQLAMRELLEPRQTEKIIKRARALMSGSK